MELHHQAKLYSLALLLWALSSCSVTSVDKNQDKIIGRYIDHENGTITDTKTNLMWKKCTEGQTGNNCSGQPKFYSWAEAKQKAKTENFAGFNDWRLPTSKELDSLIYCSNGRSAQAKAEPWLYRCSENNENYQVPTINTQAFPNMIPMGNQYIYWSESTLMLGNDDSSAKVVDFSIGLEVADYKVHKNQSRFVRTIKK